MVVRTAFVLGLVTGLASPASAQTDDFYNLSFSGDGETLSGNQLLEASIRATSTASFAADGGEKGDLSYGIPISVPAALLAPSVGLNYASGAGEHSWVARGWSLSHGQVSIQTILGQEAAQAYGGILTHRISGGGLDGVLRHDGTEWVYTSNGTTEGIFAYDAASDSWVIDRGGVRTFLESRDGVPAGEATEWFPVAAQDRFGNAMALEWTGTRLDRIAYGGHCEAWGSNQDYSITFTPCVPRYPRSCGI